MASSSLSKPKSEMTPEELEKKEEEDFNTGPLRYRRLRTWPFETLLA